MSGATASSAKRLQVAKSLLKILTVSFDEQSEELEATYYQRYPIELFSAGGVAHYSFFFVTKRFEQSNSSNDEIRPAL